MREGYAPAQSTGWKLARRSAFVQDVTAALTQRPEGLLSFDQVSQKLKLDHVDFIGLQDIPLAHIVGSVGRYADFTRAFFPRQDHLQDRWQRVEKMLVSGQPLSPIEVYQVGQVYFVRDGNHRVSVARQRGASQILARVWQCETPVPLQPDSDVDELLCQMAHAAFGEKTGIERLCPDLEIRLTQPDGYEDLLHEIETYQRVLSQIDRRELALDEAVPLWAELRYAPIVQIIRQRQALDEFPGRTEADLYLWLGRNQDELKERYEHHVLIQEAAEDLSERFGRKESPLLRQIKKAMARLADRVSRR